MRFHETLATLITANRPLEEWSKLIGDGPTATAILDYFLSRAHLIQITGKSYRLENTGQKLKKVLIISLSKVVACKPINDILWSVCFYKIFCLFNF